MSDDVTNLANERECQDLALLIGRTNPRTGHVYIDGNDACLPIAQAVLTSDWLQQRDATNRIIAAIRHESDAIAAYADLVERVEALAAGYDELGWPKSVVGDRIRAVIDPEATS